jgi:predicted RNA binding protein YcfA (HicA-like mRNA interferase family)
MAHAARGLTVSVPLHSGRALSAGLTRDLVKQAGLTVAEFVALLK